MKSEFKTKLIQHILNKKNGEKGFTLIELLVVIIIIGILAAIALPSFLNQASKARQSEAKTYVGSMNRSLQSYYLEKQQFAPNLQSLAVGIAITTENYGYGVARSGNKQAAGTSQSAFAFGIPTAAATAGTGTNPDTITGSASSPLKAYLGGVNIATPTGSNESTTLATLCESNLAPINAQPVLASTTTAAVTYITLSTAAAPSCVTGTGTGYTGIQ
jgi:type IV pilus assembly protein PilA